MNMLVSVVIPTYRRPELLDRCLAALLVQDFDPAAYEIVVADDAACEETRQLVARWAARLAEQVAAGAPAAPVFGRGCRQPILSGMLAGEQQPCLRYIAVSGAHGPAAARNAGWRAARGAVIAFTDDDCLPEPSWLSAGVAALTAGASGASGRVVVPLPSTPTDYERDAAGLASGEFVTANCFYERAALAAVGGFDEQFRAAWREDSDLFFTLLERGYQLVDAPEAVIIHPIRPARWGISLRQQRKSMFNALLYKKHPALYRQRIQPAPPWRYYATLAALLFGLAATARGQARLSLLGWGAWALLTERFCARRMRQTSHAPGHVAEMVVTSALIPPLAIFWRVWGALKFRVLFL